MSSLNRLRLLALCLILAAALGTGLCVGFVAGRLTAPSAPAPLPSRSLARPADPGVRVLRVIDGDTVEALFQPREPASERLRLLNVDTPERGDPGFAEASELVRRLLASGEPEIRLVFENGGDQPTRDAYGRVLAYVFADGTHINLELVRQGWSRYEAGYGEGPYADEFRAAEAQARNARRGLWAGAR